MTLVVTKHLRSLGGLLIVWAVCCAPQARAATLPDVPGEQAQRAHSPASLVRGARPLTSAPASGDMRRKNGTDSIEIAPTMASANE